MHEMNSTQAWHLRLKTMLLVALLSLCLLPGAHAHLMVAQRGTLNIVDNGAFMVISLPVSAFEGVDDDADGLLSDEEFTRHKQTLLQTVKQGIVLTDAGGSHYLQGLLLSPAPTDETHPESTQQLVAMGRFQLEQPTVAMQLQMGLFGTGADEQVQYITVSRPADGRRQLLVFSPQAQAHELMTSRWSTFVGYLKLGTEHIVTGLDHLLFLLVVLVTGWGWRHIVLALSVFTLGHAVSLTLSSFYGLSLPPTIVEPAIAATIVGMAAFDLIARHWPLTSTPWFRLALVYGCSLIHGLGLASALDDLGLNDEYLLTSLAGFNLGIESGQLLIALLVILLATGIRRLRGDAALMLAGRTASILAIGMGSIWFIQRVV